MSVFPMSWGDMMDEEERLQNITAIEKVKDELNDVIKFRNELKNTAPDEAYFLKRMRQRILDTMAYLETYKENAVRDDKICYWKTRGLICMESSSCVNEAVDALSKAVILDPSAVVFWNHLGETYSRLKNWELGRKCFLSALEREVNPVSLQNLSIWCRMKENREPNDIQEGIKYAKDALALNFSNAKSWTILGNAYMSAFFSGQQNKKYVSKALSAYRQAEKCAPQNVEVCTNKFVALKFLECFEEALRTLFRVYARPELDWRNRRVDYENLLSYLRSIQDLVDKKGKLRPKKIAQFSKQLKAEPKSCESKSYSSNAAGPDSDSAGNKLKGIIIFTLAPDDSYPYTLGMLTAKKVFVVTVFNLRRDKGFKIGDTISLPAVTMTEVDLIYHDDAFKFTKIRICTPTQIELNGKKLTRMYLSPMTIVSS